MKAQRSYNSPLLPNAYECSVFDRIAYAKRRTNETIQLCTIAAYGGSPVHADAYADLGTYEEIGELDVALRLR